MILYTCEFPAGIDSLYAVLNRRLNKSDRKFVQPFVRFIWLILRALVKCPKSSRRKVYRGIRNVDLRSHHPKGHEFEWHQFASCSREIEVQSEFTGRDGLRTLFCIELTSCRGREISQYSAVVTESETLLPPNSKFKVDSTFDAGNGLIIIQLIEIPPTDPVALYRDDDIPVPAPVPALVPPPFLPCSCSCIRSCC